MIKIVIKVNRIKLIYIKECKNMKKELILVLKYFGEKYGNV